MVNIYLIRHTESTGNVEKRLTGRENYKITEKGKMQVEKLTKYLENIQFDAVYSSPSTRAIETVKKLAEKNKIEIQIVDELSEMYFGIYDGYKWEDVNKINHSISLLHKQTNEIKKIPEQETSEQVADRMYNAIEKIAIIHKNKNILVSSHGVAIEAFLRKITKVPFVNQREEYSQKNTSINILNYEDNTKCFEVKLLNLTKHLD